MQTTRQLIRIFLASPGDVVGERELALTVLEGLRYDPLLRDTVIIEDVAWDKKGAGAPILAGQTPQDSIAAGLARPSECDIVIVIFWSRMGTPLPEKYKKADGRRYESGTEWEYEDAVAGFKRSGKPYVLLYRRSERVAFSPDDPTFAEQVAQYDKVRAFFAALNAEDGAPLGGYTAYEGPSEFREKLQIDLKNLIARILKDVPPTSTHTPAQLPALWEGSPFPGLRAFTAKDAPVFFGREREMDALLARVTTEPFVAVVGASGSGKSSLVAAGLVPRLQLIAGGEGTVPWIVLHFTPDHVGIGDPFVSAAAAIVAAVPAARRPNLGTDLRTDVTLFAQILAALAREQSGRRILVFVDQFEELFTTIHPRFRDAFVEALRELSSVAAVRTMITVRADFYAPCVEQQTLARMIESSTFPLSAPGVGALAEMITKPAERAALRFEEALPQRMLDDTGHEPGALALLAYTLDELYRREGESGVLTQKIYEEIGGVQGAIGKRSEAVFQPLGESEKAALPRVFRDLVEVNEQGTATRQRAKLARVADTPAAKRLTDALTDARLLVKSRSEDNTPMVEVAHEALFRTWPRLADWIKDTQDDLRLLRQVRTAASDWNANGRREDFLWSHERLAPVYAMRDRLGVEFEPVVADFVRPESERLLQEIQSDSRWFRQRPHIERLIEIGLPAVQTLVDSLQYATTQSAKQAISTALAEFGPAAIPILIDAINSPQSINRELIVGALTYFPPADIPNVLPQLLRDRDSGVRAAAARVAAKVPRADLVPFLRACLDDRSEYVRDLATIALGATDSDEAVEALLTSLEDRTVMVVNTALQVVCILFVKGDPPWYTRRYAPEWIESVWSRSGKLTESRYRDSAMQLVASLLAHKHEDVRGRAAQVMAAFDDEKAVSLTIQTIEETASANVESIVTEIAEVDSDAAGVILARLLSVSDAVICAEAARGIAVVFTPESRYGREHQRATGAVRREDVSPLLISLLKGSDQRLRRSGAAALSALKDKTLSATFMTMLGDSDGEMRRIAAEALGNLEEHEAVPALVRSLGDTYLPCVTAVAEALSDLDADAEALGDVPIRLFINSIDSAHLDDLSVNLVPLVIKHADGPALLRRTVVAGRRYSLSFAIDKALSAANSS